MREALAKLNLEDFPPPGFDLTQVPTVQRARLQEENAQAKLVRGKSLHDQKLLSDQDFADLQTAADVARSAYNVELLSARALLVEAASRKAELATARQHLAETTITIPGTPGTQPVEAAATTRPSPDSYAVAARYISIGGYVKEGDPLFRLVDDDPVRFRAPVPERYASEIKHEQPVRIQIEAWKQDFWGQITRINPDTDPTSRTFQIEVLVPNPDRLLKPGGFAKGWVQTRIDREIVFVPRRAVVSFAGVAKVYTIREGKAVELPVELGQDEGDLVEVRKGVKGNETIIVTGLDRVGNGIAVTVVK